MLSLPKTASAISSNVKSSWESEFLLRQIDEYIQVKDFMIRKTPTLDHGELALARNLRTKLSPGKQTEQRRKNIAYKPG